MGAAVSRRLPERCLAMQVSGYHGRITRRRRPYSRRMSKTVAVQRQAAADSAYGHGKVNGAPDHRPAVRLRAQLARARRLGLPWSDDLFRDEAHAVLETMTGVGHQESRREWATAFVHTREVWNLAYEREDADPCSPFRLESLLSA
jgi:hypothetical protein